jgi:hypothetical protein
VTFLLELGILFIILRNSYSAHITISHLLGSWDESNTNLHVSVRTFFEICDRKNTDYPYVINATFRNPEGLNICTQISLYISLYGIFLAAEVIYCLSHRNILLPSILVVCCLHSARSSISFRPVKGSYPFVIYACCFSSSLCISGPFLVHPFFSMLYTILLPNVCLLLLQEKYIFIL